jgi:hypothetical protein
VVWGVLHTPLRAGQSTKGRIISAPTGALFKCRGAYLRPFYIGHLGFRLIENKKHSKLIAQLSVLQNDRNRLAENMQNEQERYEQNNFGWPRLEVELADRALKNYKTIEKFDNQTRRSVELLLSENKLESYR